jgi:hypothetical protein
MGKARISDNPLNILFKNIMTEFSYVEHINGTTNSIRLKSLHILEQTVKSNRYGVRFKDQQV